MGCAVSQPPLCKDNTHTGLEPSHATSFYLNDLVKGPIAKGPHSEILRCSWGGGAQQSSHYGRERLQQRPTPSPGLALAPRNARPLSRVESWAWPEGAITGGSLLGEPGSGVRGQMGRWLSHSLERPLQVLPAFPWPRGSGRNQLRALKPPTAIPARGLSS